MATLSQICSLIDVRFLLLWAGKEPAPKKPKVEGQGGGKGGGFSQPLLLSQPLRAFLGCPETELPRCEVVKRMWAYIKEHQLQVWFRIQACVAGLGCGLVTLPDNVGHANAGSYFQEADLM